jgi:hypothetical protein
MKAWSYSSLTSFETCPRRYEVTRVTKEVVEPPTEATIWGTTVHTALEDRVNGKPLEERFQQYEQFVEPLERVGKPVAEMEIALTKGFDRTGWEAADAWCRGIIDVHVLAGDTAIALDWKTGKPKPDASQLKLFAAMMFHVYPQLSKVKTGYVWLAHDKLTTEVFTREQLGDIWKDFLPRVRRLEIAFEENKWPAKPSGLCRNWCPVGRSLCQHCGG